MLLRNACFVFSGSMTEVVNRILVSNTCLYKDGYMPSLQPSLTVRELAISDVHR